MSSCRLIPVGHHERTVIDQMVRTGAVGIALLLHIGLMLRKEERHGQDIQKVRGRLNQDLKLFVTDGLQRPVRQDPIHLL